ncbi:electron transfer flavoprotein subunit alpha/FixB family protein [Phytoactinopolyspora endophytica]|uniref:electron transfer flavoprotein subunit alpha/FixB family protein n=1 Tax=Phytoactinopolyspora endophytica TaxID=1642495 RepID=UPI00101BCE99|nr:electron transfer flavoprotein subunit alpha/FixB family protein [Phytoactinopolyspora endophytica]
MLVLIEHNGEVAASSLEALTVARAIADDLGEPVEAVVFTAGTDADPSGPTLGGVSAAEEEALRSRLERLGVSAIHSVAHPELATYSPERWGESLAQLIRRVEPSAVVAAGTDRGNEIMAQAAARADLPLATNCSAVASAPPDDPGATSQNGAGAQHWRLTRVRQGGMLLEDAELAAPVALATIVPGSAEPNDDATHDSSGAARAGQPMAVEVFEPRFDDAFVASRLVERTTRDAGVSLATARVVVSGGRGVGSADGFASLEELAKLTAGAVGCSRVVTNNGWRPHSDQVGQTGTKVNPDLYIACGISGATQHWVGCMGAKAILAINTDADAPMVDRATYAVIGDVADVVPAIVDEIHRRAH